jgi:hypothetical protein
VKSHGRKLHVHGHCSNTYNEETFSQQVQCQMDISRILDHVCSQAR